MENINLEKQYEEQIFKLLKKFALISRRFCEIYCIPDGLAHILQMSQKRPEYLKDALYDIRLAYDYDYYAFTKSTKTLQAIIYLLKDKEYNFNEDVKMLIRSIFENHILSRYFRDHIDNEKEREQVIKEFIKNPLGISFDFYEKEGYSIINKNGEKVGKVKLPSKYKSGKEIEYYSGFYQYLCDFTHCSFATIECYFNGSGFYYDKNLYRLETLLFALFVFTKIFEGVVAVKGEDYRTPEEEVKRYDLVYDSIELQEEVFEYLINMYSGRILDREKYIIQYYLDEKEISLSKDSMRNMLVNMRNSLDDEIGSVEKGKKDSEGKYIRKYPK